MDSIHIQIAEVLFSLLRDEGDKALITYSDLSDEIDNIVTPRNLAGYIGDLSVWSHEFGAPMISALVVNKKEYMPGNGFFKFYEEEYGIKVENKYETFKSELNKVRKYMHWDEFAEELGIDYIF